MSEGRSALRLLGGGLMIGLLAAACARVPDTRTTDGSPMQIFLLAGQSNMAGRGQVTPADSLVHPRIFMLDREGAWVPAVEPVHYDKPGAGVGPGLTFACAIVTADPTAVVGLVPAAVGGSPITTWVPGAVHDQTGTPPYDDAISRARQALTSGQLAGILWHQGESDANPAAAALYEDRLEELIERLRSDLNAPGVPFVIGQLGQWPERPWTDAWREVDRAHRDVAARVPDVAFVLSDGLAHRGDTLHFSAEAAREFGLRYAAAYLRMRGSDAAARCDREAFHAGSTASGSTTP